MYLSPHTPALLAVHRHQGNSNNCGPYTSTMVLNALLGLHLEPDQVAQALNRPHWRRGRLVVRRVPNSATFPWGMVDLLGEFGLRASWRLGVPIESLPARIAAGEILLPILGLWWPWPPWGHVLALVAHDPEGNRWGFVDPMTPDAQIRWRSDEYFRSHWRTFGRVLVTVPAPDDSSLSPTSADSSSPPAPD